MHKSLRGIGKTTFTLQPYHVTLNGVYCCILFLCAHLSLHARCLEHSINTYEIDGVN